MIVASDGSGDFQTIQQAIDGIPASNSQPVVIRIKNGIYKEKVFIDKPWIRLIGEDPHHTVITYDDYAKKLLPNGEPMNTLNTYSCYIGGHDFTAENITFANTAGSGQIVGQAVAAYVDADRAAFKNCRFLGCQDTLFTGPIPRDPLPVNIHLTHPTLGIGKKITGPVRQYYESCYIEGDVDYIFGSATAIFNRCTIATKNRQKPVNGYITAASTSAETPFGYVFLNCTLTGSAGPNSVYLGRPWRNHAKVAFLHCWMGEQIITEGWHNWYKPEAENTVNFAEYQNEGPGAKSKNRAKWAKLLTDEEAKAYTFENIFSGWRPDLE